MRATVISGILLLLAAGAWAQPRKHTASGTRSGKAVLEAYVSAWNRHDFAAFDKILAPDAVHEDIALGVYAQGISQIKDFMQKVIQGQPDLEWRVSRFVESGPVVVAEWTWASTFTGESPTGPVKDQRVSGRGVSVVLTKNGQIKHLTDYYDLPSFFRKSPADAIKGNK
ncbi:MAG: ester cyclase [Chlamydiota bacterium]